MKSIARLLFTGLSAAAFLNVQAALLVDENFSNLTGWTDTSGGNWSVGTNLTYAGFTSSGNSAFENTNNTGQYLQNASILGSNTITDDNTYWGAFLMQATDANTAARQFGFRDSGAFRIVFNIADNNTLTVGTRDEAGDSTNGNLTSGSAVSIGTGTTNLVLFRIDAKAGNDDLYVWYNPNLATFDSNSTAGTAFTSINNDNFATTANLAQFYLNSSNTGRMVYDEIRLGDSFTAVIPEPGTFALVGVAGLAMLLGLRRRR